MAAGGLAIPSSNSNDAPLSATSPIPLSPIPGGNGYSYSTSAPGTGLMGGAVGNGHMDLLSDDPYAQLADLDFSGTVGYQTDAPRPQGAGREDLLF